MFLCIIYQKPVSLFATCIYLTIKRKKTQGGDCEEVGLSERGKEIEERAVT